MKGTLSLTRTRSQTYSTRSAGRPVPRPRLSPAQYRHTQFPRKSAELHALFWPMPPFGNVARNPPLRLDTFRHPLTWETCSATITAMAKTHKSSSSSSSRSKATARGKAKSQKKKSLGTPPPPQRGGVELVDPLVQAQLKTYDEALSLFHQQKFAKAKQELEEVLRGPSKELADRARMHLKIAEQRMKPSHEQNPRTADEHYQRGVVMMNIGRWDDARESLDKARKAAPKADHIHYALAALDCLTGEADSALANLKVAIHLRPENRYHARNDEDFAFLQEDPRFTELLYPEKDGLAS